MQASSWIQTHDPSIQAIKTQALDRAIMWPAHTLLDPTK
jgi:hypothetical protein